jgi:protein ERP2
MNKNTALATAVLTAVLIFLELTTSTTGLQIQIRLIVNPSDVFCLHQHLTNNLTLHYAVMVISGNELDIGFRVETSPVGVSGALAVQDHHQVRHLGDKIETVKYGAGDYSFCFDNSYSAEVKHVSFYLASNDDYQDPMFEKKRLELTRDELGEELDTKVDAFRRQFDRMSKTFEEIQVIQTFYNQYELIDRETAETNFTRVNIWSSLNVALMLIAGFVQVYLIKSLFEDKSKIGQALRKAGESKRPQY